MVGLVGLYGKVEQEKERQVEKRCPAHIAARISPYPNSNIQRFYVPDSKVTWKVCSIAIDLLVILGKIPKKKSKQNKVLIFPNINIVSLAPILILLVGKSDPIQWE